MWFMYYTIFVIFLYSLHISEISYFIFILWIVFQSILFRKWIFNRFSIQILVWRYFRAFTTYFQAFFFFHLNLKKRGQFSLYWIEKNNKLNWELNKKKNRQFFNNFRNSYRAVSLILSEFIQWPIFVCNTTGADVKTGSM